MDKNNLFIRIIICIVLIKSMRLLAALEANSFINETFYLIWEISEFVAIF